MLFWVIAAAMTAIATLALLAPVARTRSVSPNAPESHDVEVYRDQLSELDRDIAGGLVEPAQADVARTEISRRLLNAARKSEAADAALKRADNRGLRRAVVLLIVVFMPVAGITAYLKLGQPGLPQLPLAARLSAEPQGTDIAMLVAQAERHLAQNPEDGRGWDVLGPIYLRLGRYDESAAAFRKAISLLGPSPVRLASLGEALFSAAGGIVTEEANLAFQTARELNSNDPRPQFFLAVALAQSGKRAEALTAFNAMIESGPADAPWIPAVRDQIATLKSASGPLAGPVSGAGSAQRPGNPSAADIAAAQNMSPEERQAMIVSMIESLEARLAENPTMIEGWLRLVRSHVVTGDRGKAQAALDRAFAVFAASGPEKQALSAIATELDLAVPTSLGGVPLAPGAPALQAPATNLSTTTPFILPNAGANPGNPAPPQTAGGPSQSDIAAAADTSSDDRTAMIRLMVASLDAKLSDNPDNLEGWLQLVRSYVVLGDAAAAGLAFGRASLTFPDGSEGGQALTDLANQLGLEPAMESK